MLANCIRDSRVYQRLRADPWGPFLDGFLARLEALGFATRTVRDYLGALSHFTGWAAKSGLMLASFGDEALASFERHARSDGCGGGKSGERALLARVRGYLSYVREQGGPVSIELAPIARKRRVRKPKAKPAILTTFEQWMVETRRVTASTLRQYSWPLHRLFARLDVQPQAYRAEALRDFLAEEVRGRGRKAAETRTTAVRFYLRFLAVTDRTSDDLEAAVLEPSRWGRTACCAHPWGLLGQFIQGFKLMLEGRSLAPTTVGDHLASLRRFDRWANACGLTLERFDEAVIETYRDHLVSTRRPSVREHRFAFAIRPVRVLLDHLRHQGAPVPPRPVPRRPVEPVLLVEFGHWLMRHRGLCATTIVSYVRTLRELFGEMGEDPEHWDAHGLRRFLLGYGSRHGRTGTQHAATAMRVFLRYLAIQGLCAPNLDGAIPTVAGWRLASLPRYLPAEAVERVLGACDPAAATGSRDRAILLLLARMGLRAGDVVELRLGDIDWQAGTLKLSGKGRRQCRLPLTQEVGDALCAYIETRRPLARFDHVFLRSRPLVGPFSRSSAVSDIVATAIRRAGVKARHRGAHVLRHSAATEMLRQGASLQEIGAVLRHRFTDTTEVYAKVDFELLRLVAQPWPEVDPC
jgi:site-specific recombinase XerD